MNYEDELERSRARRSRKRESTAYAVRTGSGSHGSGKHSSGTDNRWASLAEPGSRASRTGGASGGNHRRRKKKNGKTKRILIGVAVAVVVLILAAAFGGYAYLHHNINRMNQKEEFDVEEVKNLELSQEVRDKMEEGFWTVAVFGLDSRDSSTGAGNQSDVIMIVNLDRKTGEIKLVSVYRDTYLNISDRNTYNKINAAYAEGGPSQAVKALNKNLDLNITHYAVFNWAAVATAINILGGVDIDISRAEFYYINAFITETVKGTGIGSVQLKSAGLNHLDGVQAVAYGRLRLMDSDYARTERQRLIIQKAFEKAKKADLATLNSLVGNMCAMCATNIDINDILPLVTDISKFHLGETTGFPAARSEQRVQIGSSRLSCVIPQTLESNVISLHSFLFGEEDYTPTSSLKSISSHISEISGLYTAGEEIGHVATDQGYIPKATTAAAAAATGNDDDDDDGDEAEASTDESGPEDETAEGESSPEESESGESAEDGMNAGGWESRPTDENGEPVAPDGPSGFPYESSTSESDRPKSPADMTTGASEGYGPGYEPTVPEATTSPARPGETESSAQTSVIIVDPTVGSTTGPGTEAESSGAASPGSGAVSPGSSAASPGGTAASSEGSRVTIVVPGSTTASSQVEVSSPTSPAETTAASGPAGGTTGSSSVSPASP